MQQFFSNRYVNQSCDVCGFFFFLNNYSMSFGSPPSRLWTLSTLGVQIQIEPWDCPSSARKYCDESVSSSSFDTSLYSPRVRVRVRVS